MTLISAFQALSHLFYLPDQGRRAARLALAFILRAFGARVVRAEFRDRSGCSPLNSVFSAFRLFSLASIFHACDTRLDGPKIYGDYG